MARGALALSALFTLVLCLASLELLFRFDFLGASYHEETARYLREVDSVLGRATTMSVFEQQRHRAELVNELPGLLRAVTADQVQAAAGTLTKDTRTVLELRPGTPA